jgi:N-acetylglucosamine malate deacetylase 1
MDISAVSLTKKLQYRCCKLHVALVVALIRRTTRLSATVSDSPTIVFAPHQDDETLGCGGLIALKRSLGVPVQVVFLTNGDAFTGEADAQLAQLRRTEATNALAALGVPPEQIVFWGYPDGQLRWLGVSQQTALLRQMVTLLATDTPLEIYVPHAIDQHDDHEATHDLVKQAIDQTGKLHRLYQYPIWVFWKAPLFWRLKPCHLRGWRRLNIQAVLPQKQAAIAAHASQLPTLPAGFLDRFRQPEELFYRDELHLAKHKFWKHMDRTARQRDRDLETFIHFAD